MKKWIISLILILTITIVIIYIEKNKNIDLFNKYYKIENEIFETVNESEIKDLIKNKVNGLIFIANKNNSKEAKILYNILDDNEIELAYFSLETYQKDYLESKIDKKITYPIVIGISEGNIVGTENNINEDNILDLIDSVYGNNVCRDDC